MNNICDGLEMKIITHYLLVLNKCLFEAVLNWKFFIVLCLLREAACEAQAAQDHHGTGRLSGHRNCPPSLHMEAEGTPLPGALKGLGSQAALLYILSKIQMSGGPGWLS